MYGLMRSEHPLVFLNEDIPHGLVSFFTGFYTGLYIKRYDKFNLKKKNLIRLAAIIWLAFFVILTIRTNEEIPVLDMCLSFSVFFWPPLIILCYNVKWLNAASGIRPINYLASISIFMFVLNYPIIKTIKVFGGFDFLQTIDGWIAISILIVLHIVFAIIWGFCNSKIRNKDKMSKEYLK